MEGFMNFKMFFGNVVQWFKSEAERIGETLDSGWARLIGRIGSCYSFLRVKRRKCQDRTREFFCRSRRNLIEHAARFCAWFIDWRNDIRLRLDEIFQSRLIAAQTEKPVRIQADVQKEATWMFFRTNHPVITTEHLTFNGSRMQLKKQTPMVKALFRIPGVAEVALMRYNVRVTRGSMFPVNDLTPKIMSVLREHLI
jgi:hypothetical protein